jgi:hypothetical protein
LRLPPLRFGAISSMLDTALQVNHCETRCYKLPAAYNHEELGTMIGANRVAVTRTFGRL